MDNQNNIRSINFSKNKKNNDVNKKSNKSNENVNKKSNTSNENVEKKNNLRYINFTKNNVVSKNNQNINSDNNIDNIFFNNIGENNINKFISNTHDILINEEIAIKNSDILYGNDIVYLKELENQLLSEYQVSKQGIKFVQKEVEKVAKKIIEVKNIGIKKYEMMMNGIEYNLIDDIINDVFNNNWIIPIVIDKHKIYIKLKEDELMENQEESNIYFSESHENKSWVVEENQRLQFIQLKNMYHEKALNKISYKDLLNNETNLIKPYISVYKKNDIENIGYIKKPKNDILVIRYSDLDSIHWNTYKINSNYIFNKDIFDETGKIKGVEEDIFINGDEINIIGYMILGNKSSKDLRKKFNKIGTISKIFNSGNSIIIECINHGLKENELIYLEETNSFPRINNTFSKSLKIIDKNLIEINLNIKLEKEGNYGNIYALSSLKFDLYNISKEDNDIKISLNESKYTNSGNKNNNKIYLFDNININRNDYINIIKKIVPNINDILKLELNNIKKAFTFDDINNIFKKYSLSIDCLNVQQISIIKFVLNKNLEKIMNIKNNNIISLNFNKNNKKYFKLDNYFLADKYIKNNNIERIYGKYIFYNKPEDNLRLRLKWIETKKDNGKLYYLYYLLYNYKKKENNKTINYINNKIIELEKNIKQVEKNLKEKKNKGNNKLYKFQAYIVTDTDAEDGFKNLKKTLLDDTIIFYKNNLYIWQGKLVKIENLEENTLALVGNELWIWKNNKWSLSLSSPIYNNIQYLCELNNIDIENIKLDSLECIYRKNSGCNTKIYLRLYESYDKLKYDLENFKRLKEYILNDTFIKNIENQIDYLIKKYYMKILNNSYLNTKKIDNSNNIEKEVLTINYNDKLSILIKLINGIQNNDLRLNYIYNLIDKDGLIINNEIYSKKYNRKFGLCGHYYFFKKMNYSNSPNDKIKLLNVMLSEYSDNGETEKHSHTCKCCGMFLSINDYDDTEGFSSSGAIIKSREIWEIEEKIIINQNIDLLDYAKVSDLEDKGFKELLLKYGLSIDDIDDSISILNFIIKNLYSKTGVKLDNENLINIIIDCIQKIKNIIPYSIFRIKKIKQLQEKGGMSKINIGRADERNIFKSDYDIYYKIKRNSIISSRFLISIQTNIPPLSRSSKSTICPFYSFNGDEGINYMACILDEMKIIKLKDKTIFNKFKITLEEEYNNFKEMVHIKELYKKRKIYDIQVSKKVKNYEFKLNKKNEENLSIPVEINIEYNSLIKSSTNIKNIIKLEKVLLNRLEYVSKKIKKTVQDTIQNAQLTDSYIGLIESSCCSENSLEFIDYYYFIMNQSDNSIREDINESKKIFDYYKYFIKLGSIHKYILYDNERYSGIYNSAIVDNENNVSQELINSIFEVYVDTGPNAGSLREYIVTYDDQIDIKTGMKKKDILLKKYSIEEYNILLRNIEKNNIKYYKEYDKYEFEKSELDKLKKISNNNLDKQINNLVNNLSYVLNKDELFVNKYINLIRKFGVFYINDKDDKDDKNRIKNIELKNKNKLNYIKKFYINKLKKYLSIIKNNKNKTIDDVNLNFIESDLISLEIQNEIYKDNDKLSQFLNEDIRKYFDDIILKYTNEEINSINGIDNIYDSKYEKIKKYSDFNYNDAANVILHILISQLNDFILCKDNNNISDNNINKLNLKKNKCRYICNFIMLLLEELENDNEIFNICKDSTEKINNSLKHDAIEYRRKKGDDDDYMTTMMKSKLKKSTKIDSLEEEFENEQQELYENTKYQDKIDYIMKKGKKDLYEKYGYEPSEDQLETYKDDYLKNIRDDIMFEEEAYDLNSTAMGIDVLDQGAEYGGFNDYDFETGDGFQYDHED